MTMVPEADHEKLKKSYAACKMRCWQLEQKSNNANKYRGDAQRAIGKLYVKYINAQETIARLQGELAESQKKNTVLIKKAFELEDAIQEAYRK